MFSTRIKKALSCTLTAALLCTSGGADASLLSPKTSHPFLPQYELVPPPALGRIADYFNAPTSVSSSGHGPLIILIQDLHAHYGVQRNIAMLLNFLSDKLNSKHQTHNAKLPFALAVEGAQGPIDSSIMALFPDKKIKEAACDYLMREGEMTGMEYFAVLHDEPYLLTGIENEKYYEMHRDLFRKTQASREELIKILSGIQTEVETLRPAVYSPALKDLDAHREAFEKGQLSSDDYIASIAEAARRAGIETKTDFPAFYSFSSALRQTKGGLKNTFLRLVGGREESTPDPSQFRGQIAEFLRTTYGYYSDEERKNLTALAKQSDPSSYYFYLRDLVYNHQLFMAVPPELARYLEYLHTSQSVGMDRLLHEARELSFRIKLRLAETPAEKELATVEHDLNLLVHVTDLTATEYEVRAFGPRLNQFIALCRSLLASKGISGFNEDKVRRLISTSIDYYVLALLRNRPMVENTLALLSKTPVISPDNEVTIADLKNRPASGDDAERNTLLMREQQAVSSEQGSRSVTVPGSPLTAHRSNTVVLVAGGFHTASLTQLLRDKGVSYVVITPTVDKITPADHELYIKRLSGTLLSTEEILQAAYRDEGSTVGKREAGTLATGIFVSGIAAVALTLLLTNGAAAHRLPVPQYLGQFIGVLHQMNPQVSPGSQHAIAQWISNMPGLIANAAQTNGRHLTAAFAAGVSAIAAGIVNGVPPGSPPNGRSRFSLLGEFTRLFGSRPPSSHGLTDTEIKQAMAKFLRTSASELRTGEIEAVGGLHIGEGWSNEMGWSKDEGARAAEFYVAAHNQVVDQQGDVQPGPEFLEAVASILDGNAEKNPAHGGQAAAVGAVSESSPPSSHGLTDTEIKQAMAKFLRTSASGLRTGAIKAVGGLHIGEGWSNQMGWSKDEGARAAEFYVAAHNQVVQQGVVQSGPEFLEAVASVLDGNAEENPAHGGKAAATSKTARQIAARVLAAYYLGLGDHGVFIEDFLPPGAANFFSPTKLLKQLDLLKDSEDTPEVIQEIQALHQQVQQRMPSIVLDGTKAAVKQLGELLNTVLSEILAGTPASTNFSPRDPLGLYKFLGVSSASNDDKIKEARRRLSRELHTDRATQDQNTKVMQQINAVSGILLDPEKRAAYDQFGRVPDTDKQIIHEIQSTVAHNEAQGVPNGVQGAMHEELGSPAWSGHSLAAALVTFGASILWHPLLAVTITFMAQALLLKTGEILFTQGKPIVVVNDQGRVQWDPRVPLWFRTLAYPVRATHEMFHQFLFAFGVPTNKQEFTTYLLQGAAIFGLAAIPHAPLISVLYALAGAVALIDRTANRRQTGQQIIGRLALWIVMALSMTQIAYSPNQLPEQRYHLSPDVAAAQTSRLKQDVAAYMHSPELQTSLAKLGHASTEIKADLADNAFIDTNGDGQRMADHRLENLQKILDRDWPEILASLPADDYIRFLGSRDLQQAVYLLKVYDPHTYQYLAAEKVPIVFSNSEGAGYTTGSRAGDELGPAVIHIDNAFRGRPFYIADILDHEAQHGLNYPNTLGQWLLHNFKIGLGTIFNGVTGHLNPEEQNAFNRESGFLAKNFGIQINTDDPSLINAYRGEDLGFIFTGAISGSILAVLFFGATKLLDSLLRKKKPARRPDNDVNIAAEGEKAGSHAAVNTAIASSFENNQAAEISDEDLRAVLPSIPKEMAALFKNGTFKIFIHGDDNTLELAPGQTTHAGISTGEIHIARGEFKQLLSKGVPYLAGRIAHEGYEITAWRDYAATKGVPLDGIRAWIQDLMRTSPRLAQQFNLNFHRAGLVLERSIAQDKTIGDDAIPEDIGDINIRGGDQPAKSALSPTTSKKTAHWQAVIIIGGTVLTAVSTQSYWPIAAVGGFLLLRRIARLPPEIRRKYMIAGLVVAGIAMIVFALPHAGALWGHAPASAFSRLSVNQMIRLSNLNYPGAPTISDPNALHTLVNQIYHHGALNLHDSNVVGQLAKLTLKDQFRLSVWQEWHKFIPNLQLNDFSQINQGLGITAHSGQSLHQIAADILTKTNAAAHIPQAPSEPAIQQLMQNIAIKSHLSIPHGQLNSFTFTQNTLLRASVYAPWKLDALMASDAPASTAYLLALAGVGIVSLGALISAHRRASHAVHAGTAAGPGSNAGQTLSANAIADIAREVVVILQQNGFTEQDIFEYLNLPDDADLSDTQDQLQEIYHSIRPANINDIDREKIETAIKTLVSPAAAKDAAPQPGPEPQAGPHPDKTLEFKTGPLPDHLQLGWSLIDEIKGKAAAFAKNNKKGREGLSNEIINRNDIADDLKRDLIRIVWENYSRNIPKNYQEFLEAGAVAKEKTLELPASAIPKVLAPSAAAKRLMGEFTQALAKTDLSDADNILAALGERLASGDTSITAELMQSLQQQLDAAKTAAANNAVTHVDQAPAQKTTLLHDLLDTIRDFKRRATRTPLARTLIIVGPEGREAPKEPREEHKRASQEDKAAADRILLMSQEALELGLAEAISDDSHQVGDIWIQDNVTYVVTEIYNDIIYLAYSPEQVSPSGEYRLAKTTDGAQLLKTATGVVRIRLKHENQLAAVPTTGRAEGGSDHASNVVPSTKSGIPDPAQLDVDKAATETAQNLQAQILPELLKIQILPPYTLDQLHRTQVVVAHDWETFGTAFNNPADSERPLIVINAGFWETLSPPQQAFLIGHEMGHIWQGDAEHTRHRIDDFTDRMALMWEIEVRADLLGTWAAHQLTSPEESQDLAAFFDKVEAYRPSLPKKENVEQDLGFDHHPPEGMRGQWLQLAAMPSSDNLRVTIAQHLAKPYPIPVQGPTVQLNGQKTSFNERSGMTPIVEVMTAAAGLGVAGLLPAMIHYLQSPLAWIGGLLVMAASMLGAIIAGKRVAQALRDRQNTQTAKAVHAADQAVASASGQTPQVEDPLLPQIADTHHSNDPQTRIAIETERRGLLTTLAAA